MSARRGPVVAIDGPMGAGKSTVARLAAQRLGLRYLDTGAMYRAVAWKALRRAVSLQDEETLGALARDILIEFGPGTGGQRMWADGTDISEAIRGVEVNAFVARVARVPAVRAALSARQRAMGAEGGLVAEGRDMTTVVFPDADLKIFLTATLDERVRRRHAELVGRGEMITPEEVRRIVEADDRLATTRTVAPLRRAPDAVEIDTTGRGIEEIVDEIVAMVRGRTA